MNLAFELYKYMKKHTQNVGMIHTEQWSSMKSDIARFVALGLMCLYKDVYINSQYSFEIVLYL